METASNMSWILILLTISGGWQCIAQQRTPTISSISSEQIKTIGETVELECSVRDARDYPVLWIKLDNETGENHLILSSESTLLDRKDNRLSLRYDSNSSLYTLQVKELRIGDAGTYQCQILIGVSRRVTKNVDLVVRTPPVFYDNSTATSLVVLEGERVVLECYAGGIPTPKISWRKENDDEFIFNGNKLVINAVKKIADENYVIGRKIKAFITAWLKTTLEKALEGMLPWKWNLHQ